MANVKIMIVEDARIVAKDLKVTLEGLGYTVSAIVASGQEAIQKALETQPDLVLMDIKLQGEIDGIAAAKQIRHFLDIPIIYLTAYVDDETIARAKVTLPYGYLIKPFETRSLSVTIEMALNYHQAEQSKIAALKHDLNQLKANFITLTSHEFRTPLTIILSSAELLEYYSHVWTEEERKEHLQQVQIAVKQMTQLLNNMLVLDETNQQKIGLNPVPLNLEQFCRCLTAELERTTKQAIVFNRQGDCPSLSLDEQSLHYILTNLLANAVKYSSQDSTIGFTLTCQSDKLIFSIQDQGIGIPRDEQKFLFEPFYRASNVGTIPGLGLGLTIVRDLVSLYRGEVNYTSELGAGTTFTVTLPLQTSNLSTDESYRRFQASTELCDSL